jgi:hypothetical protein
MGKPRSLRRVPSLATPTLPSAEEVIRIQTQSEQKAAAAIDRKVAAIAEESRRRLRDLVGRKGYDDLRTAIRSERRALQELRQPPEGLERDFWADHRAGRKRVDALLRKLGVSADKLKRIQNDTQAKLGKVLAPVGGNTVPGYNLANHHHHWEELTGLDPNAVSTIALPHDDPNDPHRWIPFLPPYPECDAYRVPLLYGSTDQGFNVDVKPYGFTEGFIGSDITCSKSDTGDGDYAWPHTKSYVRFPIQMPAIGRMDVVVMALCVRDYHETSMVDEFGGSYARAHHENSLYMYMVVGGRVEEHQARMSYVQTDSDHPPLLGNHLIPGTYHFAYFTTDSKIGMGRHSLSIGNINSNGVLTNDMAVRSKSSCLWLLTFVSCRIKP